MSVKSPNGVQVTLTAVKPSARTLADHLFRTARATPERVAVEWPGGSLTYADLLARAEKAAADVAPFARVPLLLAGGPDFVVAFWAVQLANAVVAGRDEAAVVIHTSGTAGASKPIELTHANFVWSALGSAVALGLD